MLLFRQGRPSGAVVFRDSRSARSICSAIHLLLGFVRSRAHVTRPRSAGQARQSTGTSRAAARKGSAIRFATSRMRSPLRKLVDSWRTGAGRSGFSGKSTGKRDRLPALRPPPVDGLAGPPTAVTAAVAEQGLQQHQLGVAGVLVFVEQDHGVAFAFDPPTSGGVARYAASATWSL